MTVTSYDGVVAIGTIPLMHVHRLEALEEVEWVSHAARVWPHIDRSMAQIKATDIRSNSPPYTSAAAPTAYTGKGVLVGVIDDRINLFHRSFMKPNADRSIQVTRIAGIWDHYATPDASKGQGPPPGFTGGTFYDEAALNAILKSRDISALKMNSQYDHGSHVAGIAAGNGWIKDNQFAEFTFVGVAPEADIVFTNGAQLADTAVVASAVKFMFDFASERGQACVINMSFGTHEGARDGSSDLEKAIDRLLIDASGNPIPGRAVVASAGNEADMERHSRKTITASGKLAFTANISPITFPVGAPLNQDTMDNRFYVWYDGAAALRLRLTAPGAVPAPAGWVNPGDVKDFTAGSVKIAHVASLATPDPRNGKKEIVFSIIPPAKFGDWKIEVEETSGNPAAVDVWVDRNGDIDIWPRFIAGDAVIDNTVTSPATAESVIAVGAYTLEWHDAARS
jgi:hypothetical protein